MNELEKASKLSKIKGNTFTIYIEKLSWFEQILIMCRTYLSQTL